MSNWKKALGTLGAALLLGASGAASYNYLSSSAECCTKGAECCKPGAACCKHHHEQVTDNEPG